MYHTDKEEGCFVSLQPGSYKIFLKAVVYVAEVRIAALRVFTGVPDVTLGGKIGETGTDSGTIGVYDFEPFSRLVKENPKEAEKAFKTIVLKGYRFVEVNPEVGGRIAIIHSGFGDGTFPVHELLHGSNRVGFEVVFIKTGEPYPFDVDPEKWKESSPDETLHFALLEKIWDPAFAEINKGEQAARDYLETLAPPVRAALTMRIFYNFVQMGSALPFLLTHPAQPYLCEQILAGFRFFGQKDYEDKFKQICDYCGELWKLSDRKERYRSWLNLNRFGSPTRDKIETPYIWLRAADKKPKLRIEFIVATYIRAHPSEFPGLEVK